MTKYEKIEQLLQANSNLMVSDIAPEIKSLFKSVGKVKEPAEPTSITDEAGNTVSIKCWALGLILVLVGPRAVEFGIKTRTKTGYNTMCTVGSKLWTQRNKLKNELTTLIMSASPEDVLALQAKYKEISEQPLVPPEGFDKGFKSFDEVREYLAEL